MKWRLWEAGTRFHWLCNERQKKTTESKHHVSNLSALSCWAVLVEWITCIWGFSHLHTMLSVLNISEIWFRKKYGKVVWAIPCDQSSTTGWSVDDFATEWNHRLVIFQPAFRLKAIFNLWIFWSTGVKYFGPIGSETASDNLKEVGLLVFARLRLRAVHLELVDDLDNL